MISHPFRRGTDGALVTVPDLSDRAAAELAGHVLACRTGERPLAPGYGLPDPAGSGVDPDTVASAVEECEPELSVAAVAVRDAGPGRVEVDVDVTWAGGDGRP